MPGWPTSLPSSAAQHSGPCLSPLLYHVSTALYYINSTDTAAEHMCSPGRQPSEASHVGARAKQPQRQGRASVQRTIHVFDSSRSGTAGNTPRSGQAGQSENGPACEFVNWLFCTAPSLLLPPLLLLLQPLCLRLMERRHSVLLLWSRCCKLPQRSLPQLLGVLVTLPAAQARYVRPPTHGAAKSHQPNTSHTPSTY